MWILLPTLRLSARSRLDGLDSQPGPNFLSGENFRWEAKRERKAEAKRLGEDDEELQRILLVFEAGGKNRGFSFYQSSWSSVTASSTRAGRRSDEADSCRFRGPRWFFPARRNHLQLFASELRPCATDTQSSSGIKPVHTCDRLRGDWGFRPRFGWTFGSQRHLWLPSDDFELLLDGVGLFSGRNAPGDPRFYTRTNQCLEGNMQMSRGLVDFSFVGCLGGGFWFTGGEQTRRKNRSLSSCKYFYSNLLSLLSVEVYAGSSCSFWAEWWT